MNSTLIIFSTTDGQTQAICKEIASVINRDNEVEVISLENVLNINLSNYKQIVLGASIRYGKHDSAVYKFIKNNISILNKKKAVFFTVNAVARKPEKDSPETNPYIQKFLKLSNWNPALIGVFAGKIDYPKYNFVDKQIIRFIMWLTKGPTDTSQTYEFTNWGKVKEFANEIILLK